MDKDDLEINVSVTFRHTESTPALKSYASEKVTQVLKKFITHNADVHIILDVEKRDHLAEVVIHSKGFDLTTKSITGDLYSSIDKLADTMGAQLRKIKQKHVDHHKHANAV